MRNWFSGRVFPRGVFFAVCFVGLLWGRASALDAGDIGLMHRNGVPENVIADMIRRTPDLAISQAEASRLRADGLPEHVLGMIPRNDPASEKAIQPVQPVAPVAVSAAPAAGDPILPLDISVVAAVPSRFAKEGWLSIGNRDWQSYYLAVDQKAKRMFLSRTPNGGVAVNPGESVTINIRKETYKLYGESGLDLPVKIRDGETTRLTLTPFGAVGNSGLTGVVQDRERVRSETLFSNYVPAPAVIIRPSPVIVREAPAVIVAPAPRPYYRPYRHGPYRGYGFWYHR